ncbi:hypothetical protein GGR51DRAFT_526908 [Nemania sp. FL0031]|nr:hypothetical protein GGR51DRAFT_526908 [Nemania sp. FL0031]
MEDLEISFIPFTKMDAGSSEPQTVPVADERDELLSSVQIPISFTSEWQTSDPDSDAPTEKNTFVSQMAPYICFIDTGIILLIASLLFALLLGNEHRIQQPDLQQTEVNYSETTQEFSTRALGWEFDTSFALKNITEFSDKTLGQCKSLVS